jgi:hypothetical protein
MMILFNDTALAGIVSSDFLHTQGCKRGQTALGIALEAQRYEVAKLLLDAGADREVLDEVGLFISSILPCVLRLLRTTFWLYTRA